MTNSTGGTIDVTAAAHAVAADGPARAYATIANAISQYASSVGTGAAANVLDNDGTISIAVDADANAGGETPRPTRRSISVSCSIAFAPASSMAAPALITE